jgi:hypothetical protein
MAEKDLAALVKGLRPEICPGRFYFASIDPSALLTAANFMDYIVAIFREDEGLTLVYSEEAKEDLSDLSEKSPAGPFALISLRVESDLYAVGLLSEVTAALAKAGISVNAFSGYHHDHLFVPFDRKDEAMKRLNQLKP